MSGLHAARGPILPAAAVTSAPAAVARATIAQHSKSFALASRLLPSRVRDQTAVVYTYCRRADDAIDGTWEGARDATTDAPNAPPAHPLAALATLRAELDTIYGGLPRDPVLAAFQTIAHERAIPRDYPAALLAGMAMDVEDTRYTSLAQLGTYCFRVAGVVGLMMCHVFGVRDDAALVPAARLGLAMQLTNICRDVVEDWRLGRLYVPDEVLAAHGASGLAGDLGRTRAIPRTARAPLAASVRELLDLADDNYRVADAGIPALPWRAALAVRAARNVYSAIGSEIRAHDCDVTAGRAVVPTATKLALVASAGARTLVAWPGRIFAARVHVPARILHAHEIGLGRAS